MNYEQANQLILVLTDIKDELHQINTKLEDVKTELKHIQGGMP